MSLASFILNMMNKGGLKTTRQLIEMSYNPLYEQENFLLKLLNDNKNTEIGKEYNFKNIKSIRDFQKNFPLTDYEFYKDKIDRLVKGEKNILTKDKVVHFNVTSGTMGEPKKLPVIEKHVKIFNKYYAQYLTFLPTYFFNKKWMKYKGLSLSEGTYEILPTGVSCGCASSLHTARMMKRMPMFKNVDTMAMMYTSPKEARQPVVLGTYTRYLHAVFALMDKKISYGNVTFSSYLLEIMRFIENNWEMLCGDIENGTINKDFEVPDEVRKTVEKKMKPNKTRADELRELFSQGFKTPIFDKVWPNLEYFICVAGAGFQSYTDKLIDKYFGKKIHFIYLGLSASEGLFSIPLDINNPNSVFIPNSVFFEFIPMVNGEKDLSNGLKLLNELEEGKEYELVITTINGLYRYQMNDVIKVTGFFHKTPMMQFVNRSGYAINMYAEKTSEKVLQQTAVMTSKELCLDLYDYIVCPYEDEKCGKYVFMYEFNNLPKNYDISRIQKLTEKHLEKYNPIYKESIDDGSLKECEIKILQEQTFLFYKDLMIMKGKNAAQLKPIHVADTKELKNFFFALEDKRIND